MRNAAPILVVLCLLGLPIAWAALRAGVALARDRDALEDPPSRSHLLAFPLVAIVLWYIATHWGHR